MVTNILLSILIVLLGGIITLVTIWWFKYGKKLYNTVNKISKIANTQTSGKPKLDITQLMNEVNKLNNIFKK
jgi:hypothetical protein